jgi:hypothetical protein
VAAGDFVHINKGWPSAWENTGDEPARLLWLVTGRRPSDNFDNHEGDIIFGFHPPGKTRLFLEDFV